MPAVKAEYSTDWSQSYGIRLILPVSESGRSQFELYRGLGNANVLHSATEMVADQPVDARTFIPVYLRTWVCVIRCFLQAGIRQ